MPDSPQKPQRRSIRLKGYDYTSPGGYFVTMVTYQMECLFGEIVDGEMKLSPFGQIVHEEWFASARIREEIELFDDEFVIMPNHIHGIIWIRDMNGAEGDQSSPKQTSDLVRAHGHDQAEMQASGDDQEEMQASSHEQAKVRGHGQEGIRAAGQKHVRATGHDQAEMQASGRDCDQAKVRGHSQEGIRAAGQKHVRVTGRSPVPIPGPPPKSLGSFVAGFKSAVTTRINAMRHTPGARVWHRNYYDHIIRDERSLENIRAYIAANPARWTRDRQHPRMR